MKSKIKFNVPNNGHTSSMVIEVTSENRPMVMPGCTWFNILPIDSYQVIEKECTEDYKDAFIIEPLLNKTQVVVRPLSRTDLFFMEFPETIEE
jgi:hypothetical protein